MLNYQRVPKWFFLGITPILVIKPLQQYWLTDDDSANISLEFIPNSIPQQGLPPNSADSQLIPFRIH